MDDLCSLFSLYFDGERMYDIGIIVLGLGFFDLEVIFTCGSIRIDSYLELYDLHIRIDEIRFEDPHILHILFTSDRDERIFRDKFKIEIIRCQTPMVLHTDSD